MHVINAHFDRPDAALVAAAAKAHVGVLGFHAGPRQTCDPAIKPLDPAWRICGPAFTVRPEQPDDLLIGELAPKYAQPGDVLVVDGGGITRNGCWGMGMSTGAKGAGCAGVVVDGAAINGALLTMDRPQLPIFARGLTATARGSAGPGSLNVPVICGGVIVNPGDIVVGDADGVVILPPELARAIIERAERYRGQAQEKTAAGIPYYERQGSLEKLRKFDNIRWNVPNDD